MIDDVDTATIRGKGIIKTYSKTSNVRMYVSCVSVNEVYVSERVQTVNYYCSVVEKIE